MFKQGSIAFFSENSFARSRLTGAMIARNSEAFRQEQKIEFLCSLSPEGLDDVLNGVGDKSCLQERPTAARGPIEVNIPRSEMARFRAFSVT